MVSLTLYSSIRTSPLRAFGLAAVALGRIVKWVAVDVSELLRATEGQPVYERPAAREGEEATDFFAPGPDRQRRKTPRPRK
jgi:hypothetical protein